MGDSLEHPQHINLRAEAVLGKSPFETRWSANPRHLDDDRFSEYEKLAPGTNADIAYVQHMIHHLANDGVMAVIVPQSVLYRRGAGGRIRRYWIETLNYLDSVILLPAKIFYFTEFKTSILVFKKRREHPGSIFFINASGDSQNARGRNYFHEDEIKKIVGTYRERRVEDEYSYSAPLEEVKENDYNLNIALYMDAFEAEERIDLRAHAKLLQTIEKRIIHADTAIAESCRELNILTPFLRYEEKK